MRNQRWQVTFAPPTPAIRWYPTIDRVQPVQESIYAVSTTADSVQNNPASPAGSRASSIASDDYRPGTPEPSRRNTRQKKSRAILDAWMMERNMLAKSQHRPEIDHGSGIAAEYHPVQQSRRMLERPTWEPPILDYRKFEEGGRMYDSLHRHPETNPEQWYEYTDAEIERELLGDYHDWIQDARLEAESAGNEQRRKFYEELSCELDVDRLEPELAFSEIKERLYRQRPGRRRGRRVAGKRVQEHFNVVKKIWLDVDSSDSEWDEEEWAIFGEGDAKIRSVESGFAITEANLWQLGQKWRQERSLCLKSAPDALGNDSGKDGEIQGSSMKIMRHPMIEAALMEKKSEDEQASGKRGLIACFGCCFG